MGETERVIAPGAEFRGAKFQINNVTVTITL